jgi:acyl-CoA thioesterase
MSFSQILAAATPIDGGSRPTIPPDWHQGRTAYGGISTALALTAAMRAGGEGLPPLRSAQMSMIAPLFGEVEVRAQVLRRGKNATWISAEVEGEQGIGLAANFVFMGSVESALTIHGLTLPPDLISVDEAVEFRFHEHSPVFLKAHFEVRHALPRRAEKRPEICWWVRLRERSAIDPTVELLLVADATPPGVGPLMAPSVPVSTMQWQVNLLTPLPETRDGWWLLRSTGDHAQRGFTSQDETIWNADGDMMLAGMQSIALFG